MARRKRHDSELDLEAVGHVEDESQDQAPEADEGEATDPETDLQRRHDELEQELGDLQMRYQRALADHRNYHQRAIRSQQEARVEGAAEVLRGVIRTLDYFDMALGQDPERATAEQILGGVRMIKDELVRAIGEQGVATIEPEVNQEFDPNRHEAVQQQAVEGVEPGRIAAIIQPGYALHERVLRPAKVAIAPRTQNDQPGDAEPSGETPPQE